MIRAHTPTDTPARGNPRRQRAAHRRHRVAMISVAVLLVTGTVTACSGSGSGGVTFTGPTLAIDEGALAKAVAKKVGTDVTVTCPDDVPLRKGEVTLCTVTDGIYVNELILTQEDDVGNVAWKVGKVLSGPSS